MTAEPYRCGHCGGTRPITGPDNGERLAAAWQARENRLAAALAATPITPEQETP